jgi:hypothetical protein
VWDATSRDPRVDCPERDVPPLGELLVRHHVHCSRAGLRVPALPIFLFRCGQKRFRNRRMLICGVRTGPAGLTLRRRVAREGISSLEGGVAIGKLADLARLAALGKARSR